MSDGTRGLVIRVGDRFFYGEPKGRFKSAWSIAGARIFGPWDGEPKLQKCVEFIAAKGYKPEVWQVACTRI